MDAEGVSVPFAEKGSGVTTLSGAAHAAISKTVIDTIRIWSIFIFLPPNGVIECTPQASIGGTVTD
jgi:hypothetical protein